MVRRTLVLWSLETRTLKSLKRTRINVLFSSLHEVKKERKFMVRRTLVLRSLKTRTLKSLKRTNINVLFFIIPQCQKEKKKCGQKNFDATSVRGKNPCTSNKRAHKFFVFIIPQNKKKKKGRKRNVWSEEPWYCGVQETRTRLPQTRINVLCIIIPQSEREKKCGPTYQWLLNKLLQPCLKAISIRSRLEVKTSWEESNMWSEER